MAYTPMSQNDYINQQKNYAGQAYQNQYDSQRNALDQAYQRDRLGFDQTRTNLQNNYTAGANKLNELRQQTQPTFQQNRNAASVNAAQSARRLSELMAAKGLSRGGSFMSGQAGIQNQRAAQIADVNQQEGLFNTTMGNRASELEQIYQGDLSNIEKQRLLYEQQYSTNAQRLQEALAQQKALAELQAPLQYEDYYNNQLQNSLALAGFAWGNLSDYGAQTGNFGMPSDYKPGDFLTQFYNQWYK